MVQKKPLEREMHTTGKKISLHAPRPDIDVLPIGTKVVIRTRTPTTFQGGEGEIIAIDRFHGGYTIMQADGSYNNWCWDEVFLADVN